MKKILLVESDREILENTAELLSLAGYDVCTAIDGKAGVGSALSFLPDLIVSAIMMPGLDGYGVLHLIRKHPELAGMPFIFLTAKSERADVRKGMEMGADDYITKPFTDTELLQAIEARFKRADWLAKMVQGAKDKTKHPKATLDTLFAKQTINKYKKKQIIFSEGNHPYHLFYVISGKVKAFKTSEDGKELIVGLYAKGEFMGYTALLEDDTYKVTAKAIEDCEIAMIAKKDFSDLINGNSAVAHQFVRILANNNNQKAEYMVQLAYDSLRKRVAAKLIFLIEKYKTGSSKNSSIHIRREELANLSGTSTESLIRTLSDFRNEGLIFIQKGDIEIIEEDKLRNMMN